MTAEFEHVSDTALLVAAARAIETERQDGLVHDPFAARLAGEKGMALARSVAVGLDWMTFGIGLRSHFIDELLMHALGQPNISTVLNLGAGLDARPYRLDLPRDLRWIEVDFAAMVDYKAAILANKQPRCRLERISADINNESERREVLASASAASSGTLMITEGLLMYLPAETLRSLATEAIVARAFKFWLFDVTSPYLQRLAHGGTFDRIHKLRAETHLEGEEILKVFNENGWAAREHRGWIADSGKVAEQRVKAMAKALADRNEALPAPQPADDVSGIWLYEPKR